jgi:hypothetical protein
MFKVLLFVGVFTFFPVTIVPAVTAAATAVPIVIAEKMGWFD